MAFLRGCLDEVRRRAERMDGSSVVSSIGYEPVTEVTPDSICTDVRCPGANRAWQQRGLHHVWHPCTQTQRAAQVPPLPIARAQSPWLEDFEGRRYFDATSSWRVNLFGHGDTRLNDGLRDRLDRLPHVGRLRACAGCRACRMSQRPGRRLAWALLLCKRRRFNGRNRAEDEFSPLAQSRASGQARVRLPASGLPRRDARRVGRD